MKNTTLVIYLVTYFIFFLQYGYPRTVSIESIDIPDELIYRFDTTINGYNENNRIFYCNIWNSPHQTFYCKNNICTCIYESSIRPFMEFPDKNGIIYKYILSPYATNVDNYIYNNNEINNNETIYVSINCKTNSQCFSNKCVNNTCTYNIDSDVQRCDHIYDKPTLFSKFNREGYLYCGRMVLEECTKDTDCSFKNCEARRCSSIHYEPSDSDSVMLGLKELFEVGIFIILGIICCCCCCCYCFHFVNRHKKNNINSENKK